MTEVDYWRCPGCLATIPVGEIECPRCGEVIPEVAS